jgi:hypothetical protein
VSSSLPRPLARLGVVVPALLTALAAALAGAGAASAHVGVFSTAADAAPDATGTATDTAAASSGHGDTDPGALALLVSIVALFTGVAGVVLGWRAGRRTVSS